MPLTSSDFISFFRINWREPFMILFDFAVRNLMVEILNGLRYRTNLPVTHRSFINFNDRSDFRSCAAEKHLVGGIQLGAIDFAPSRLDAQLLSGNLHNGMEGDALEDVVE